MIFSLVQFSNNHPSNWRLYYSMLYCRTSRMNVLASTIFTWLNNPLFIWSVSVWRPSSGSTIVAHEQEGLCTETLQKKTGLLSQMKIVDARKFCNITYNFLHEINSCNIVGGASYLHMLSNLLRMVSPRVLWFGYLFSVVAMFEMFNFVSPVGLFVTWEKNLLFLLFF